MSKLPYLCDFKFVIHVWITEKDPITKEEFDWNKPTFELGVDMVDMTSSAISLEYDNTRERSNAIEFDRKTAGNISKAVQNVLGYTFPPNLLPQFVEEKQIKNESKMKRLKFKKPFNGVNTALKVIPESYKVDNRVFELTDGNEHYRVRWEGSLTEGKGIVLSSFHQEALNEDVAKIKHLMGFKSQDTLGNLKGGQRLKEDKTFFDMLKKSQALNEAEAKPDFLDLDKDGDKKEPMKKAAKDAKSTKKKGIQESEPDDDFMFEPESEDFDRYDPNEFLQDTRTDRQKQSDDRREYAQMMLDSGKWDEVQASEYRMGA